MPANQPLAACLSGGNMTKIRAFVLLLIFVTACVVVALPVLVLDRFPAWVGLLVLVGVFVLAFLLSLLAARWLVGNRRAEFAARLQRQQVIFTWACAIA